MAHRTSRRSPAWDLTDTTPGGGLLAQLAARLHHREAKVLAAFSSLGYPLLMPDPAARGMRVPAIDVIVRLKKA